MKDTDIKAEFEAIHQEIAELKKAINHQAEVINNNKDVLHELLGILNDRDLETL